MNCTLRNMPSTRAGAVRAKAHDTPSTRIRARTKPVAGDRMIAPMVLPRPDQTMARGRGTYRPARHRLVRPRQDRRRDHSVTGDGLRSGPDPGAGRIMGLRAHGPGTRGWHIPQGAIHLRLALFARPWRQ